MVPFFRSLNLILSFPRLLENATAAIEPDFGRLFGPRLGSSRDITLQGVVRQKAGRPLWGRTSAGVFGIDREAAFYFCSQMRDRVLTARPQLVFVQARQNRRTGTIAKIQKPSKKLTRPSREEGNA
jgi:hypothetical protein